MSSFAVKIEKVEEVQNHPNADRLDLIRVLDWWCVTSKGSFQPGDLCVYFPIDSILPENIESAIFGPDSKVKLEKSRVRTIKLRGAISQGLAVKLTTLQDAGILSLHHVEGHDVTAELGVTKYEPPEHSVPTGMRPGQVSKKQINPYFHKYTDIENAKNYPNIFQEGETVWITEKIHGCLHAETKIDFVDGTRHTIQEIVLKRLEGPVWGTTSDGTLIPARITNWFDNGISHDWVRIKFTRNKAGRGNWFGSLVCTPNHEIFSPTLPQGYTSAETLSSGQPLVLLRSDFAISYVQEQILFGIMLGDGSLFNRAVQFGHKEEHRDYIDFTLRALGHLAGTTGSRTSGYGTRMITGKTISSYAIDDLFKEWNLTGIKRVPVSIVNKLGPIALAFWYMDDGSLGHQEDQEDRALFATCGFDSESVSNLIAAFANLGISATKYLAGPYWRIRLNADEAEKLFVLIAPYVPACMQYKLPERYRGLQIQDIYQCAIKYKPALVEQKVLSVEPIAISKLNLHKWDIETETHNFFADGILVHNSSARAGWLPTECNTLWKKVLRFFSLLPKYEFVYGSRNVQLQDKISPKTFYGQNFYAEWVQKYKIKEKLKPGEVLYGEIYGDGIQKGYTYGCKSGERRFVAYDVQKDGQWLNYADFQYFCDQRAIPIVPILDVGGFHPDFISPKIGGASVLAPEQKVREGLVVRSYHEEIHPMLGRRVLKYINPEYLLREETSFH